MRGRVAADLRRPPSPVLTHVRRPTYRETPKGGTWCPGGRRLCGSDAIRSRWAPAWSRSPVRRPAGPPAARRCPRPTTRQAHSPRRRRSRRSPRSPSQPAKPAATVPSPDAPVVGSSAAPVATKPRVVVRTATATPSPAVSRPSSPAPHPVVTSTTPSRTKRAAPKPSAKPKPAPTRKAKAKPKHAARTHATASAAATPRDAIRFGLPAAVLSARDSGGAPRAALLVAAALLLAVAAGGSTVLGVAARSATRQA